MGGTQGIQHGRKNFSPERRRFLTCWSDVNSAGGRGSSCSTSSLENLIPMSLLSAVTEHLTDRVAEAASWHGWVPAGRHGNGSLKSQTQTQSCHCFCCGSVSKTPVTWPYLPAGDGEEWEAVDSPMPSDNCDHGERRMGFGGQNPRTFPRFPLRFYHVGVYLSTISLSE